MPTVEAIIVAELEKDGYDCLLNYDCGCSCEPNNLAPCGQLKLDCELGHTYSAVGWDNKLYCGVAAGRRV